MFWFFVLGFVIRFKCHKSVYLSLTYERFGVKTATIVGIRAPLDERIEWFTVFFPSSSVFLLLVPSLNAVSRSIFFFNSIFPFFPLVFFSNKLYYTNTWIFSIHIIQLHIPHKFKWFEWISLRKKNCAL